MSALTDVTASSNGDSEQSTQTGKPSEQPSLSSPPPLADSSVEEASADVYRRCHKIAK